MSYVDEIENNLSDLEEFLARIEAGGPGSGCHGPNCGRPPGSGKGGTALHDAPEGAPGVGTTGTLMKDFGWKKVPGGETTVKGHPATMYTHPTHGTMFVTKNWYEHYKAGEKIGEKTELAKGKPLAEKLKTYLKENTPRPGSGPVAPAPTKPAGPKPTGTTTPQPKPIPATAAQIPNRDAEFKFKEDAGHLGGAHDKYLYTDKLGKEYLFKPATTLSGDVSPLMAHADEMASRIAQKLRPYAFEHARAAELTVPGQGKVVGSVHEMLPNIMQNKDFSGVKPKDLKPEDSAQLQREQVIDWLISNHDSHGGQFIRSEGGKVIGIDKTQAFKYFGKDKLDVDYHPNASYGEKPPYYNDMWKAVKKGDLTVDPMQSYKTIQKAQAIPDDEYRNILMPYAKERFKNDDKAANEFLDKAVGRKNALKADFEKFIGGVYGKPFTFNNGFSGTGNPIPKPAGAGPKPPLQPGDKGRPAPVEEQKQRLAEMIQKPSEKGQGTAGHVIAWEPYVPPDNPQFKSRMAEAHQVVADVMSKYSGPSQKYLHNFDDDKRWEWEAKINSGKSPVDAAKGLGVYPEAFAKMGFSPGEMHDMIGTIKGWTGSSSGTNGTKVQEAAQQIINGKCCSSKVARAFELEYALTQAKLAKQVDSAGKLKIPVWRGVNDTDEPGYANQLEAAAAKHDFVETVNRGAESYSTSLDKAKQFGRVILQIHNVPAKQVLTSALTNPAAFTAHHHEAEMVVAHKGNQKLLAKDVIIKHSGPYTALLKSEAEKEKGSLVLDLTDDVNADWYAIAARRMHLPPNEDYKIFVMEAVE